MRRVIAFAVVFAALAAQVALGNPRPCYDIIHVRAFPPEIGITCECNDSTDLSGDTIFTASGIAIIDSGVFVYYVDLFDDPFILDSTNTSGFVVNPEADSISMHISNGAWGWTYIWRKEWGNWSPNSVPNKGNAIRLDWYYSSPMWHWELLHFDFAEPRQGFTQVILSEINAHGDWRGSPNFIELYNKSSSHIDIGGYKIICDTTFEIPSPTRLVAHGFYVLDEDNFPEIFDLDFAADNIYLINSDTQTVDQVGWSSDHGVNVSFMRYPDGDADSTESMSDFWGYDDESSASFENGFPSRGAPNRYQNPGFKVIGARVDTSGGLVNIYWTNPIWIPNFDTAVLRKSLTGFPHAPTDGQLLYDGPGQEFLGDTGAPGQTTFYTVFARTTDGAYSVPDGESQAFVFMPLVGIDDEPLPESHLLLECYPNPFNASVTIEFSTGELTVYNIAGQRLATLSNGETTSGTKKVVWHASGLPSGVYFVRLESGGWSRGVMVTLVK